MPVKYSFSYFKNSSQGFYSTRIKLPLDKKLSRRKKNKEKKTSLI